MAEMSQNFLKEHLIRNSLPKDIHEGRFCHLGKEQVSVPKAGMYPCRLVLILCTFQSGICGIDWDELVLTQVIEHEPSGG